MSYGFQLFHPEVRVRVEQGLELDEFEHPPLNLEAVEKFIGSLAKYGYKVESSSAGCKEFVKLIGGCPIQVAVFPSEISFSVPYWNNSQDAIFEALQDAAEIAISNHMAMFNPQDGAWSDA